MTAPNPGNDGSSTGAADGSGPADRFRWPTQPAASPELHTAPGPPYRDFFNAVWLELIDLPPVADELLSRTLRGAAVRPPAMARGELMMAQDGMIPHVRDSFRPPATTHYAAFPLENGCCDVIRGRYRAPPYVVDVGYANRIFAVRLRGAVRSSGEPALQTANRLVRTVFDDTVPATPIRFLQVNDADGTDPQNPAYGCQDVSHGAYSLYSPHWVDYLCWWLRPDEMGFVSFAGGGERTKAVESPSAEKNKYWFTRPKTSGSP